MGTAISFRQTINGAAVELRNFMGRGGDLRIPPYLRSLPVTRIREGWDSLHESRGKMKMACGSKRGG